MSEFLSKKVTFSISCDLKTIYDLRDMHQSDLSTERFSVFVARVLKLGIARLKQLQEERIGNAVHVRHDLDETPMVSCGDPSPKRKNNTRQVVTKKVKQK